MQIMPLVFTGFFFLFPSGLVLYWLTNTGLAILQQWRINKVVARESRLRLGSEHGERRASSRRKLAMDAMQYRRHDTIAALATAPGTGAVAIVRLSGPSARAIGVSATGGCEARPRYAELCTFRDADRRAHRPRPRAVTSPHRIRTPARTSSSCTGTAAASSATGIARARVRARRTRPAEPGEFTLRAFLNDKLDLLQAEAVADLVASGSA